MHTQTLVLSGTEDEIYQAADSYVSARKPKLNKMQEYLIGYDRFNALPYSEQRRLVAAKFATGNTTREALGYILAAGNSPNTAIKLPDTIQAKHFGGLHDVIEQQLEMLEFKFYNLDKTNSTLTFEI